MVFAPQSSVLDVGPLAFDESWEVVEVWLWLLSLSLTLKTLPENQAVRKPSNSHISPPSGTDAGLS